MLSEAAKLRETFHSDTLGTKLIPFLNISINLMITFKQGPHIWIFQKVSYIIFSISSFSLNVALVRGKSLIMAPRGTVSQEVLGQGNEGFP